MVIAVLLPLGIALVALPLSARLGRRLGAVSTPSPDRWAFSGPIPRFAGPALLVALAAGGLLLPGEGPGLGEGLGEGLGLGEILALGGVGLPGAVDDCHRLAPATKALALLPGALALAAVTGRWELGLAAFVLANSVNLLDHVDGMAGGVALGSGLAAALSGSALGAGIAGSALAFLAYNRPPASMFLGDGGAFLLGGALVLAWSDAPWPVALAGCLAPLADTGFVVARRLAAGRRPWVGGTDHLGHALLRAGAPPWSAPVLAFVAGFGPPSLAASWLDA